MTNSTNLLGQSYPWLLKFNFRHSFLMFYPYLLPSNPVCRKDATELSEQMLLPLLPTALTGMISFLLSLGKKIVFPLFLIFLHWRGWEKMAKKISSTRAWSRVAIWSWKFIFSEKGDLLQHGNKHKYGDSHSDS